jgi:hypothetical protein
MSFRAMADTKKKASNTPSHSIIPPHHKFSQNIKHIPVGTGLNHDFKQIVVNKPGDQYEQEADRIADAVVNGNVYSAANKITSGSNEKLQREEGKETPKSDEEKYKEALKKAGEAFLQTNTGKQIKDKAVKLGKDFVSTLPGKIIAGSAAAGIVAMIAATNSELPMQIPEIPLDMITPGLKIKLTYEGPARKPTTASITFIFEEQIKKTEKTKMTEKEKYRAETARMSQELEQFREGLKTPEQRAEEKELFWNAYWRMKGPYGIEPLNIPGLQQRREEEVMQRKEISNRQTVENIPPIVNEVLNSSGQPLDENTRLFMESRFGHDFSKVRVHTDSKASESADSVNALAYTVGKNVVFGQGQYAPETNEGQKLLAHELTHVIQVAPETWNSVPYRLWKSSEQDIEERDAEQVASGGILFAGGGGSPFIVRRKLKIKGNKKSPARAEAKKILDHIGFSAYSVESESTESIIIIPLTTDRPSLIEHEIVWAIANSRMNIERTPSQLQKEIIHRRSIVRAAEALHRPKASGAKKSAVEFGGFPGRFEVGRRGFKINRDFWNIAAEDDPPYFDIVIRNKNGIKPSAAVSDLWSHPDKYATECFGATAFVQYMGLLKKMGNANFDAQFGPILELRFEGRTGGAVSIASALGSVGLEQVDVGREDDERELIPGDQVNWKNDQFNENGIYLGKGRYFAQPLGIITNKSKLQEYYPTATNVKLTKYRSRWRP